MKRLCLILAYLFLFTQTASAMPLLVGQKVVYRGTITGLRIGAVDGTAFIDNVSITSELQNAKLLSSGSVTAANLKLSAADGVAFVDFSAADVLTNNIGKYIVIKDSTGKEIKGWIKAAGSGVTTSTVYTADFSAGVDGWSANWSTGYEVGSLVWDTDHAVLTVAGNAFLTNRPSLAKTLSMTVGALQFLEMDYSVVSGSPIITGEIIGGNNPSPTITLSGTDTYISSKQTCAGPNYNKLLLYFNGRDYDFVLNINAVRVKAVTAPSATGVTIVSTKGGTTYNWESKDASFTYNSSITYSIYDRDLTAYADGNHSIEIYDSSNRMLKGVLKAAGTGETLGDESITGWVNIDFDNFSSTGTDITQMVGTALGNNCRCSTVLSLGALYKTGFTSSQAVATFNFMNGKTAALAEPYYIMAYSLANGANMPVYYTAVGTYTGFKGICTDTQISSFTHKQVTTPSSSGATITTLKNGDVYNWSYKNSSFSFNSASYYVIIKLIR